MKTIFLSLMLGISGIGVYHAFATPHTVNAATAAMTNTETALKDATTSTQAAERRLASDLAASAHPALPQELQDFNKSTERLTSLRKQLRDDIANYQAAYKDKLAEFDKERLLITDAATTRSMTTLRRHTEGEMRERINNAQATLEQLDTVLQQGASLEHAAKCVLIADELNDRGADLDQAVHNAQQQATLYASTTNTLLARINHVLAD